MEHEDPADPAGQLFEMSRFFGTPSLEQVIELWNIIEPGSADTILSQWVGDVTDRTHEQDEFEGPLLPGKSPVPLPSIVGSGVEVVTTHEWPTQ